jgi:hypothetical protein
MSDEQPKEQHFNFQAIVEMAVATGTSIALREFCSELEKRGVSVDLLNEVIDVVGDRMADYRRQWEGANMVQLMIEQKKEPGDAVEPTTRTAE